MSFTTDLSAQVALAYSGETLAGGAVHIELVDKRRAGVAKGLGARLPSDPKDLSWRLALGPLLHRLLQSGLPPELLLVNPDALLRHETLSLSGLRGLQPQHVQGSLSVACASQAGTLRGYSCHTFHSRRAVSCGSGLPLVATNRQAEAFSTTPPAGLAVVGWLEFLRRSVERAWLNVSLGLVLGGAGQAISVEAGGATKSLGKEESSISERVQEHVLRCLDLLKIFEADLFRRRVIRRAEVRLEEGGAFRHIQTRPKMNT